MIAVFDQPVSQLVLLAVAAFVSIALAAAFVDLLIGSRRLRWVGEFAPAATVPAVSIVVAARNEARGLEAAVTSLLQLDCPRLEIIVVDDRSTDDTAAILDRLARGRQALRVLHVTDLPEGWLGKNHAQRAGAAEAHGDFLLFTDADVVFEPSTLRRAMTFVQQAGIDHLAALPEARVPGVALKAFVAAFGVFFSVYARPWKARDPGSSCHVGIGAFNLIRATVYHAIGTHAAIALRPDDDMKLGKLVKKHGFRQDVVDGRGFVVVEWYSSLREAIDGLMKNAFAAFDYRLSAVAVSTAVLLLVTVWPCVGVWVARGMARGLYGVSVLLMAGMFGAATRRVGLPLAAVVAFPAAAVLFAYVIWRSACIAVVRGSVTWRGTAYPLSRLRANRV